MIHYVKANIDGVGPWIEYDVCEMSPNSKVPKFLGLIQERKDKWFFIPAKNSPIENFATIEECKARIEELFNP